MKTLFVAVVALLGSSAVLWMYVWWDTRRAERRWLRRNDAWRGSVVRDPNRSKAFPKDRSWKD